MSNNWQCYLYKMQFRISLYASVVPSQMCGLCSIQNNLVNKIILFIIKLLFTTSYKIMLEIFNLNMNSLETDIFFLNQRARGSLRWIAIKEIGAYSIENMTFNCNFSCFPKKFKYSSLNFRLCCSKFCMILSSPFRILICIGFF